MSDQGLVCHVGGRGFAETLALLEQTITARGLTLFARVDHGSAARAAGLDLRDTTVLIFGNPRGGTPLMAANQTVGIDLPLHLLVWTDAEGQTRLAYDAPDWIARRHGLGAEVQPVVATLAGVLEGIVRAAL